jgi:hypothetical protein
MSHQLDYFRRIKLTQGEITSAELLLRSQAAGAELLSDVCIIEVIYPTTELHVSETAPISSITLRVNGSGGGYALSVRAFLEKLTVSGPVPARGLDYLRELRNVLRSGSRIREWVTEDQRRTYGSTETLGDYGDIDGGAWALPSLGTEYQRIGFEITLTGTAPGTLDEVTVGIDQVFLELSSSGMANFPL